MQRACGHDARGLTYALLELADRVRPAGDPIASLAVPKQIAERPANTVRSGCTVRRRRRERLTVHSGYSHER